MDSKDIASAMTDAVGSFLRQRHIGKVLLGLSGGTDSVALLRLLAATGTPLICVHCNFHLRGEESDRDMAFVERLCRELGVTLRTVHFDTTAYCRQHNLSVEMGCRELRYRYFRETMKAEGCDRIAVAHHLDDNIETLLLNLFRGSGVAGLKAMVPDTGEIIRPLLRFGRKEILSYLDACGQDFITDSTNADNRYRRNFIRNRLLPLIETEWKGARKAIGRSIELLQEDDRIVRKAVEEAICPSENILTWENAEKCGSAVTAVYRFISRFGGNPSMAEEISRHFSNPGSSPGKRWLTRDFMFVATSDALHVLPSGNEEERLPTPGELPPELAVSTFDNSDENLGKFKKPGKPFEFVTPYPPERYIFRHPLPSDRIKPLGMKGSSSISGIMRDARLSPEKKKKVWIAEDIESGEIIWAEGLKRSRHHLVTPAHSCFHVISRKGNATELSSREDC